MSNSVSSGKESIFRVSFPLFSASFVAQGLNFFLLFLLPRFYPVGEISLFFIFSALCQILGSLVSLQSQNAIVLSRTEKKASVRLGFSLIINAVFSILILLIALVIQASALNALFGDVSKFLPLVSLNCFLGSSIISLDYYFTYRKAFKLIGVFKLVKAFSLFLFTLGFGLYSIGQLSLIYAFIGGQLIAIGFVIFKGFIPFHAFVFRWDLFRNFLVHHRELLFFETSFNGISQGLSHLPVIFLSVFYGDNVVAYYGMAQRIFATPIGIWSQSVSQVFYKRLADMYNSGLIFYHFVVRTFKKVITLSFFYGLVGVLIAPWLLVSILGESWAPAGTVSRIILPLIVVQNAAMPLSAIFTVLRSQRRMLPYFLVGFLARIIFGFIIPYFVFGASYIVVLILSVFLGIVYYFLFIRKLLRDASKYEKNILNG